MCIELLGFFEGEIPPNVLGRIGLTNRWQLTRKEASGNSAFWIQSEVSRVRAHHAGPFDIPSAASLHGNVMSMITEAEPYGLVTPGIVCTNGTPPYVIVVVGPTSEFEERSIIFMIRSHNQSLFEAWRINAANNCQLKD